MAINVDAEMARRLNQKHKKYKYGGMAEEDALKMVYFNPQRCCTRRRTGSMKRQGSDMVL